MDCELELAAYTDGEAPADAVVEEVEPGWEDGWREFHRPVLAGPFWIGPPWDASPPGAVPVVIDPGRAFGTGAHPTTRLCVELVSELEPAALLDVGCGSGVIAIAAALLGFSPVVALDVDPAAVDATARNATANGVSLDVRLQDAARTTLPGMHVAVANVSLEVVQTLLTRLDAEIAVVSGYLETDEVLFGAFRRRDRRVRDGWAADLLERAQ